MARQVAIPGFMPSATWWSTAKLNPGYASDSSMFLSYFQCFRVGVRRPRSDVILPSHHRPRRLPGHVGLPNAMPLLQIRQVKSWTCLCTAQVKVAWTEVTFNLR